MPWSGVQVELIKSAVPATEQHFVLDSDLKSSFQINENLECCGWYDSTKN